MKNSAFYKSLFSVIGVKDVLSRETIQELWSGYGEINRISLAEDDPIVVKHVRWPESPAHPRGWSTATSHQRKVKSYEVEIAFYSTFASQCSDHSRVPRFLGEQTFDDGILLVLEDLDAGGFTERVKSPSHAEIALCLSWLANFHARFLGVEPQGLWEKGTYWHLDTRPDELEALTDTALKTAAPLIDKALDEGIPQTLVHGDAKLANFCFHKNGKSVAAVDFQYVGGGCGMKDVAYFMGGCLTGHECEAEEAWVLDYYFSCLRSAVESLGSTQKAVALDLDALEEKWRFVFPCAWADFDRFLKGWSPGHWKINRYSENMCRRALEIVS